MSVTYYVAMPFVRNEEGELVAGEAQDRATANAAESLARRMAETAAGAVAFSRTGDPATGEFEDAVVLRQFGEVPKLDNLLGGNWLMPAYTFRIGEKSYWIDARSDEGAVGLAAASLADAATTRFC